ncbi:YitT family protein [Heliobacterium gestii]|uniref:YitT family protein n=1 Tax=Heliomicrobium gestii TaxID=2699 RepID=A0A845LE74_HELGE|nr:YitT family protein [Heliomicrobium gestii]MBM7867309.1 putative membrane protein YczE [Heliomicrobium gestii]MZP43861.1 YitT family protein [Heliomicrobium gestii]
MQQKFLRFLFYTFGIIIMTFGISLTIQSHMGTGPFDALLVGLYKTFGLSVGSWEISIGLLLVLLNALAQRRTPEYVALLTSFITGIGIDFWLFVTSDWIQPCTILARLLCFTIGLGLGGFGIAVNLQADFAPNPMDRSMQVVRKLTGWNLAISRAFISIFFVILAYFFHGPIAVGTILSAVFSGITIKIFTPYIAQFEKRTRKDGVAS